MDRNELRTIRKSVRLNQQEFGDLTGYGRVAVSDWERGENPIPGAVEIVARILEEQPEMLIQMERWRGLRKQLVDEEKRSVSEESEAQE